MWQICLGKIKIGNSNEHLHSTSTCINIPCLSSRQEQPRKAVWRKSKSPSSVRFKFDKGPEFIRKLQQKESLYYVSIWTQAQI